MSHELTLASRELKSELFEPRTKAAVAAGYLLMKLSNEIKVYERNIRPSRQLYCIQRGAKLRDLWRLRCII